MGKGRKREEKLSFGLAWVLGQPRETLSSSRKLLGQSRPTQPQKKSAPPLRKRTEPVLQSSPLHSDSQGKRCHPLGSFSDSRLQLNQRQSPHLCSESERNLFSNLHRCARTAKGNVVILSEASRTVTSNSTKDKVRTSAQKANGTCSPIFTAALGQPRETLSSSRKLLGQSPPTQPKTKSAPPLRKRTEPVIQSSPLRSDSQGKRCHPLGSFSDSHRQLNDKKSPHLCSESERNLFSNLHRCARTAKGNVVILSEASRTVTSNSTKDKVRTSAQKANGTCSPIFTAALGQPRETLSSSRKLLGQSPPTQPKQSPHLRSESERNLFSNLHRCTRTAKGTLSFSRKLLGQSPPPEPKTKSGPALRKRIETCSPIFTAALGQPRKTLSSSQKLLGQSPPTQQKKSPHLCSESERNLFSNLHRCARTAKGNVVILSEASRTVTSKSIKTKVRTSAQKANSNLLHNLHRCTGTAKGNVVILSEASRTVTSNSTKDKVRTSAHKANRNLLSNLHRCTRTAKGNVVILSEASRTVTSNSTKNKVRASAQKASGTCYPIFTAALGQPRETLSSSRKLLGQSPPTQRQKKSAPLFRKRTEPVIQSSPLRSDSQGKRCHPLGSFSDSHRQLNDKKSPHLRSESERNLFSNLHRCARTAKGNVVILSEASRTVTSNSTKNKVRASAQKANGTCSPIFTAALGQPRETLSSSRTLLGQSPPTQPKTKSAPPLRKRTEPVLQSSPLHSDSQGKRCHPLGSFSDSHRQLNDKKSPHLRSESERNLFSNLHRCARTAKGNVVILSEASRTITSNSTKDKVRASAQKANGTCSPIFTAALGQPRETLSSSRKLLGQSPPTQRQKKSAPLLRKRTEPVLQSAPLRSDSQGKRCHPLGSFSDSHLQLNQNQSPHLRSENCFCIHFGGKLF